MTNILFDNNMRMHMSRKHTLGWYCSHEDPFLTAQCTSEVLP